MAASSGVKLHQMSDSLENWKITRDLLWVPRLLQALE
jgi:hypothetical protein